MSNQPANASHAPERPSFFGLPPRWRYMSYALYWGGTLSGVGLGIFLAAILIGLEVIKLEANQWNHWISVLVLAFFLTGQVIAQRAVRAGQSPPQAIGDVKDK